MSQLFDLNVEKVLGNWEVYHAIREVIANALDESILTRTKDIQISKDKKGDWHIRDFGRGLSYKHLTQKENKEKFEHSALIGKFGVGLKDALAVFDRQGISILIRSRYGDMNLVKSEKTGFKGLVTLHVKIDSPIDKNFIGTDFILHKVSDEDIKNAKNLFLKFSDAKKLENTKYGEVIGRNSKGGFVYINGVKVAEEENFLFSYNITLITAEIRKALNRERINVGRTAYAGKIRAILVSCESEAVARPLIEDLKDYDSGKIHDELKWIDVQERAVQILNSKEKVIFLSTKEMLSELSPSKKLELIKNNIYGLDLDERAVAIAKLNIYLKILGSTRQKTIADHTTLLPELRSNIKFGNSIIGDENVDKKAFDWAKWLNELDNKHFDVIIGNPPYDVIYSSKRPEEFNYYKKIYGKTSAQYNPNLFAIFIDKMIDLLAQDGELGFIVPDTLLTNKYFSNLRKKILDNCSIKLIVDLSGGIFQDAIVDTIILIIKKEKKKANRIKIGRLTSLDELRDKSLKLYEINQAEWRKAENFEFRIRSNNSNDKLIKKLETNSTTLGNISRIYRGIVSWDNKKYVTDKKVDERFKPLLIGKDATRYSLRYSGHFIQFDKKGVKTGNDKSIYEANEKILIALITGGMRYRINASLDESRYYVLQNYNSLVLTGDEFNIKYLLGLLNSKLLNWYYASKFNDKNIKRVQLMKLPIKLVSSEKQNEIAMLVDKLIKLNSRKEDKSDMLKESIIDIESKLDYSIYQIYGLDKADIELIDASFTN